MFFWFCAIIFVTLRLTRPIDLTERHKLWIPLRHVDTSDQRWGHTQLPSSVPLFLTTPFLSFLPNLLTHRPSLLLFLFSAYTQLFSSHSIPHLSRPSTTLSPLPFFSPLLPLVDFPTLSAHVWCPPSDRLRTWQSCGEWHHHYWTGKRQRSVSRSNMHRHLPGNGGEIRCVANTGSTCICILQNVTWGNYNSSTA